MTIAIGDIPEAPEKAQLLLQADEKVESIERQFQRGLITDDERYEKVVEIWKDTTSDVSDRMQVDGVLISMAADASSALTSVGMMTSSGARAVTRATSASWAACAA
ncbi:hypothetical protein BH24CHL6_BH24CHL6_06900 [soil metagenome]